MRVKEIEKTANIAWSPSAQYPILLATGTTAQQLDASFNTSAVLEIYGVNLSDPSYDLDLLVSVPSEARFHKLCWGAYGVGSSEQGLIVGGCDGGKLEIYDAGKLLNNQDGCLSSSPVKHTGAIRGIDFNPFQKNLLATGASKCEIFIWDINNIKTPMTPGTTSQPPEDVVSLAWNKQVQHILSSTFATRCTVWDLRKNEPIIKLSDTTSKIRWRNVNWNPQVATQLCLCSEEDQSPIIQLWDLRFATSPIKILHGHQKGVLSASWCDHDGDLFISCGKDNKLMIWNPNSTAPEEDILSDITVSSQWNFDISWCARNPFLVCSSSYDGRTTIYSISGGQTAVQTSNKIADSFPGMNEYQSFNAVQHQQQQHLQSVVQLRKPPKWMKRPRGLSFGFGGKLVTYGGAEKIVYVSQVVTEPDLMIRTTELDDALETRSYVPYCLKKSESAENEDVKKIWLFIAAQFNRTDFKGNICDLLGTSEKTLNAKQSKLTVKAESAVGSNNPFAVHNGHGTPLEGDKNLTEDDKAANKGIPSVFDEIESVQEELQKTEPLKIVQSDDVEGLICDALLLGNIELAVDLCMDKGQMADAIVLAIAGGQKLFSKVQAKYFEKRPGTLSNLISAVVTEDWFSVVETCDLSCWKQILVALLTYNSTEDFHRLSEKLGERLEKSEDPNEKCGALICYVCSGNTSSVVKHWTYNQTCSSNDVQELAELALIMREAALAQGVETSVTNTLSRVILQYSQLLSSQGFLPAAITFMEDFKEETITIFRDRLICALGLKHPYVTNPEAAVPKQPTSRVKAAIGDKPPTATFANKPQPPSMYAGALPPTSMYSCVPQPTSMYSSAPPPTAIPSGAPKSVVKPYSNAPFIPSQPKPQQPDAYPDVIRHSENIPQPVPQFVPNHSSARRFSQSTIAPPSQVRESVHQPQYPAMFPPAPPVAGSQSFTNPVPATPGFPPAPPTTPYSSKNTQETSSISHGKTKYVLDPSVHGPGLNHGYPAQSGNYMGGEFARPASPPLFRNEKQETFGSYNINADLYNPTVGIAQPQRPPSAAKTFTPDTRVRTSSITQDARTLQQSAPGWNDPPMVGLSRPSVQQAEFVQPNPITHPFGNAPEPHPTHSASQIQGNYVGNVHAPPQQRMARLSVSEVQEPKEKLPLPVEHTHLKTIFDELLHQCYLKSSPVVKRKLEDVSKKLEFLYDSISQRRISDETLIGIHEIVRYIQQGNYGACLAVHTQLVSGPDFSSISGFMTGIKMLLQTAAQSGIYL